MTTRPDLNALRAMASRLVPVDIGADLSGLTPAARHTLATLLEAARVMDELFLDQHRPFIPGVPPKPAGANFYPEDATRDEIAAWLERTTDRTAAGFFTAIRRDAAGQLVAVPYSVEYREALDRASRLVQNAAAATDEPTLARYLTLRADANRGVQTAAFNLPNDERVIREHGSKRVMFKNVQHAKFERVLAPIADRTLAPRERARVSFDAFFTHILLHELMHGLGPHDIEPRGRRTTVRQELKDTYSASRKPRPISRACGRCGSWPSAGTSMPAWPVRRPQRCSRRCSDPCDSA